MSVSWKSTQDISKQNGAVYDAYRLEIEDFVLNHSVVQKLLIIQLSCNNCSH